MAELKDAILYYADHPYEYVVDWIGVTPTEQQKQILLAIPRAIKERKVIACKSGHGTGKTALETWIIKWFMDTRPNPRIPCTAPTQHQLFDVLWAELAKWNNQSVSKGLTEWTKTHFTNRKFPETWFAVARSSKKPENLQGFHADHLLFMIEEASGVPQENMVVVEGALTNDGALCMMFGNPTQITGTFFDYFHIKRSFAICFTLNSEDSPLVSKSYCELMAKKYGKDSDIYRVRVLGKFPKAEPDTIISLSKVEQAIDNDLEETGDGMEIGVDVARFGDDETIIYSRIGNKFKMEKVLKHRDTMQTVGEIAMIIKNNSAHNPVVNVDDTGVGGGVTDRLKELVREKEFKARINGVNNGSSAMENNKYINKASEMWFWVSEHIEDFDIPNDEDLVAQLSARKYSLNSKGIIEIEQKREMKKRGLPSPDRADAFILSCNSLIAEKFVYVPKIA